MILKGTPLWQEVQEREIAKREVSEALCALRACDVTDTVAHETCIMNLRAARANMRKDSAGAPSVYEQTLNSIWPT